MASQSRQMPPTTPHCQPPPSQQAPVGVEVPSQQAPVGVEVPLQQAPVGVEVPSQQAPVGVEVPSQQAPVGVPAVGVAQGVVLHGRGPSASLAHCHRRGCQAAACQLTQCNRH
jgi:hypothetical protein